MARASWLAMPDASLLADCEVDVFRASGPGGQKRNKTSSAVRLRHRPSGVFVTASKSRSQHKNRRQALSRLREALAFSLREPVALEGFSPPPHLAEFLARKRPFTAAEKLAYPYLEAVAELLDVVAAAGGSLRQAAQALGLSTAALSRLIATDLRLARRVAELRTPSTDATEL